MVPIEQLRPPKLANVVWRRLPRVKAADFREGVATVFRYERRASSRFCGSSCSTYFHGSRFCGTLVVICCAGTGQASITAFGKGAPRVRGAPLSEMPLPVTHEA